MANDLILNRFFTKQYLKNLIDNKCGKELYVQAAINCGVQYVGRKNEEVIADIYSYISHNYRNEYYYKNALLNKLVFGKYKPTTTSALTEVSIGRAKADFILINGKAVVYEIKTELDNLGRLADQIHEYYKAFRYVTVATYPNNYRAVLKQIDNPNTGICVINEYGRIDKIIGREPKVCSDNLDYDVIFRILRKKEFEEIITQKIGNLPKCSAFQYYRECLYMIRKNLSLDAFQKAMEGTIKARPQIDVQNIQQVPAELRGIAYFSDYMDKDYQKMKTFLNAMSDKRSKEEIRCTCQF